MILSQMEPSLQRLSQEMADGRRIGGGRDRAGQRGRGQAVAHHDQQRPAPAQPLVRAALPAPSPLPLTLTDKCAAKSLLLQNCYFTCKQWIYVT